MPDASPPATSPDWSTTPPAEKPPVLAADKQAEAVASSLNNSAERFQTLWISFVLFTLYVVVATGTTTHRMLFLEEPIKLPVLNIDLPLLGFYILAPLIYLTFHIYVLMQLVLLARTATELKRALSAAYPKDTDAQDQFRMRLENSFFLQLIAGARPERRGPNAVVMYTVVIVTLVILPMLAIIAFLERFLPYHQLYITWWHRIAVCLDLVALWILVPAFMRWDGKIRISAVARRIMSALKPWPWGPWRAMSWAAWLRLVPAHTKGRDG
jgi:hypothetical protein